ncbi:MAG: hypothetical protein JNM06_19360 [Blastocatellia bacterium]|nr:hypothetical protein [Blastocatellia bacterium]
MEANKEKSIEVEFKQEAKEAVALVEATENEMLFLQGKYGEELSWEKDKDEYLLNVCDTNSIYGQAQTLLSISIKVSENIINGRKVIFWSACSKLVDYRLIDVFLRQHYPNAQVKTDATNFHLIANLLGIQISASDGAIACEVVKDVNQQTIKQISNNGDDHATKPNIPNIPNAAINPVINFLANIDKNVEEKLAKWSKAKKLTLAASLCLLGLLGATFTVFSSVKDAVNTTAKSVKAVNSPGMEQSLALSKTPKTRESLSSSDNNSDDAANGNVEGIGNNENNEAVKVAESWQSIESLLASTPQRRKQALTKLGLRNNGDYVIAAISLGCDSCIRLAKDINANSNNVDANNGRSSTIPIILVTIASESEIKTWQREHLLSYPVQSISESIMNDLGIVFFPTLIKINSGQVVGVSQSSSVLANSLAKQQASTTKQTSIAKEVKEANTSSSIKPVKSTK